jgi:PAS domain S-box-containing protein
MAVVHRRSKASTQNELKRILDSTPFLLNRCSRDLRYLYVSKACAAMFGRAPEEIAGKPMVDIIGRDAFETIRPHVETVLRGHRVEYEAEVPYASAGPRHVHVIYVPERDEQNEVIGWIASILDITEQKKLEARRFESEERFRNMANHAPVMLWMAGRNKLCDFFNQGWLEFTGRTMDQEIGNGWAEGVHPGDFQRCLETYHSAFDALQPFEMDYRLRRHDGEYRWVLDRGSPRFDASGEFVGYVGSAVDINDRKRAEENDRQLAHLQRLVALGGLAAALAHELQQPLAAIMANAEIGLRWLESANPPLDELREVISDIREDDKRASELINRIREFMTKRATRIQPLDISSTVAEVLRFIGGDATRRRVQLRAELAEGLPSVLGDRGQLQQVLINLAVNGMDAMTNTPEATRCLTIQTKVDGDGYVEAVVIDRGGGIAPDKLAHLFEPFVTTKAEGMGLGLAISRSIIESHRGRIWAENIPDGGAAFHFTVPAEIERPK